MGRPDLHHESLALFVLREASYDKNITSILLDSIRKHGKICFVSSTMTWNGFLALSKAAGIGPSQVLFVDTLSKYYAPHKSSAHCLFVCNPQNHTDIKQAVVRACHTHACQAIVLDSLSDYWSTDYVVGLLQLVNAMGSDTDLRSRPRSLCVVKQITPDDYEERVKDFTMLAEKVVEMNSD
jgi:hypothetical protein